MAIRSTKRTLQQVNINMDNDQSLYNTTERLLHFCLFRTHITTTIS